MGLDQTVTIILAVMGVITGTYMFFDSRGGWTLYWAEKRWKRK